MEALKYQQTLVITNIALYIWHKKRGHICVAFFCKETQKTSNKDIELAKKHFKQIP
ncbi:MAG: type II toxin-antitoxin system RelE/ParE family toxin [Silvanigrellaceae bacterium]|nr:type II toxin-antitoxin system RelE/ParE family toxin [Silvanigrellaceae bacterium]